MDKPALCRLFRICPRRNRLFLQASNTEIDTLHPLGKVVVLACPDYLHVFPNPVTENLTIDYKKKSSES
jgi:hypothetical protein